jgi:phosphopantothenoylcysteine decarboxylase/phosphopantothenate--cysteine ligase
MSVLSGKKVILGVTAGIAAYKSAFLVRELIRREADVRVVMTPAARDFVTPLTLSTLSKNEVLFSFTDEEDEGGRWNNHVEMGLWADLFLIAPATANTLSKMAHGTCDNLLLAVYLSAKCPVYYAPAMDLDMYKHPSTAATFEKLQRFGNIQIPAEHGELASGLVGQGRMAEPLTIVEFIEEDLYGKLPLRGKRLLVTAGPTYEPIDPVRFIGNHSSGKMGFALARAAAELGAEVTLVSGPSAEQLEHSGVRVIRVQTAQEMLDSCLEHFDGVDALIMSAAVADYRPAKVAANKIKKSDDAMTIDLVRNPDILKTLSAQKQKQIMVGFALETDQELEHAKGKLQRKDLDLIVLNSLQDDGAGFGTSTNKVTLIDRQGAVTPLELKSKSDVARDIIDHLVPYFS